MTALLEVTSLQQLPLTSAPTGVPADAVLRFVTVAAFAAPMLEMSIGAARGVQAAIELPADECRR